jgi:hypothetical protein
MKNMFLVCSFLANENTIPVYNELVEDHCDIEEITPNSKITWCKMPKVLCIKPRDFVTFCSHRWWKDGTQVIVNQACEHEDMPGVLVEGEGDVCRGYALRGANCECYILCSCICSWFTLTCASILSSQLYQETQTILTKPE